MKTEKTTELEIEVTRALSQLLGRVKELEKENAALKERVGEFPDMQKTDPSAFDCLSVTQVQVFPFKDTPTLGTIKAMALIVLNDQLVIRGLRVMDGVNGLFVSYPLDPFFKGEDFRSVCNPITRALREHIENCVLEKYAQAIEEA